MAALEEAGFPFDDTLEVTRVLGRGMVRYAEALRVLFAQRLWGPATANSTSRAGSRPPAS